MFFVKFDVAGLFIPSTLKIIAVFDFIYITLIGQKLF